MTGHLLRVHMQQRQMRAPSQAASGHAGIGCSSHLLVILLYGFPCGPACPDHEDVNIRSRQGGRDVKHVCVCTGMCCNDGTAVDRARWNMDVGLLHCGRYYGGLQNCHHGLQ